MAGAEGLEPSARGFGDRCSTNWAIPLNLLNCQRYYYTQLLQKVNSDFLNIQIIIIYKAKTDFKYIAICEISLSLIAQIYFLLIERHRIYICIWKRIIILWRFRHTKIHFSSLCSSEILIWPTILHLIKRFSKHCVMCFLSI